MADILVQFLMKKFLEEFQKAEPEFPGYSQFRGIKDLLEGKTFNSTRMKDKRDLLYDLNQALEDCVALGRKRKAHKTTTFSLPENIFLRKTQKHLRQINTKLREVKGDDGGAVDAEPSNADASQGSRTSFRQTDDSLERALYTNCEFHGFDRQLEMVVDSIKERGAVGIVGMGGSGKTALAQMAVNKFLSQKEFDVGFWVDLSGLVHQKEDETDDETNSRVLVKCVRRDLKGYLWVDGHECSMQEMEDDLLNQMRSNRFLIVFDGAKHVSRWYDELFLKTEWSRRFPHKNAIMVTSRLQEVAEGMVGEGNLHHMKLLSDAKSCWSIFMETVGENGLIATDHPTLLRMKDEIVEACYGLPLAAKTLAEIIPRQIYEANE